MALTGPEALKAENKCNALEERVENIQNLVQQKMKEGGLKIKETSQEISRIGEVSFFFCVMLPKPRPNHDGEIRRGKLNLYG